MATGKSTQKFDYFKSNVQSAAFHPLEPHILLVGDCNGQASVINAQTGSVKKWKVCGDEIEKVLWNPFMPYTFLCGTSSGFLYNVDCRNENAHLYSVKAHNQMISGTEFRYYQLPVLCALFHSNLHFQFFVQRLCGDRFGG